MSTNGTTSEKERSGVYLIACTPTKRVYVGSAVNIQKRWRIHLWGLTNQKHPNSMLQRAWNKYGSEAFTWTIIEQADPDSLIEREQHHIDRLQAANRKTGFNLSPTAGSVLGIKRSDETRARQSKSRTGYKVTEETKALFSVISKERWQDPEYREKASQRMLGSKINIGRKHTAATKAKISATKRASGLVTSDEQKAQVAAAMLGRQFSPETRAKIAEAKRQHWKDPEYRNKLAAARQRRG